MKQSARIQTAIDILDKFIDSKIPMDNTIRDYMHYRRYIGSKDRAAIVEMVYEIVRSYARISFHLDHHEILKTPRSYVIAHLFLTNRDMTNLFTGEKHAPDPLTDDEKTWIAKLDRDLPLSALAKTECPDWAQGKLRARFGDDFESEMLAMIEPAPLDLRVNTLKATVQQAQEFLAAQNVTTTPTLFSPVGLRVEGKAFMSATKAFSKGMVEIQDEGSQLISLVCGAKPGMRVVDYCAGAGGKTLGIAAAMANKGNIVAMDIDPRRLEKGRNRYRKAGVHNVELRCLDDEKNKKWLRRQKETMDIVLVDAPCSSSGTWRRNPDLRWKQYGPSLAEIMDMQSEILERVADKVKIGGRLVYATCSLFDEENDHQIEKFLNNHPEFKILPISRIWEDSNPPCPGPYLKLTPHKNNTDGFFAAALERI